MRVHRSCIEERVRGKGSEGERTSTPGRNAAHAKRRERTDRGDYRRGSARCAYWARPGTTVPCATRRLATLIGPVRRPRLCLHPPPPGGGPRGGPLTRTSGLQGRPPILWRRDQCAARRAPHPQGRRELDAWPPPPPRSAHRAASVWGRSGGHEVCRNVVLWPCGHGTHQRPKDQ